MRKLIYILILSVSNFFTANAQEKKVNLDSFVKAMQTILDTTNSTPSAQQEEVQDADTSLRPNQLTIPIDSIESWKNLKAFAYAKYLDSLLKERQEKEKLKIVQRTRSSSSTKTSSSSKTSPSDTEEEGPGWFERLFASPITRVVIWILAILFVLFIVYKLFLSEGAFRKRSKKPLAPVAEVTEEIVTSESDFDALISKAVQNGNYRHAVRYQYLKVLHRLAEKHLIEMAADKTNYQYVREVGSRGGAAVNQQFQNDFASLTLSYEYVWYGEFGVDNVIYRRIETGFNQFNQKI